MGNDSHGQDLSTDMLQIGVYRTALIKEPRRDVLLEFLLQTYGYGKTTRFLYSRAGDELWQDEGSGLQRQDDSRLGPFFNRDLRFPREGWEAHLRRGLGLVVAGVVPCGLGP